MNANVGVIAYKTKLSNRTNIMIYPKLGSITCLQCQPYNKGVLRTTLESTPTSHYFTRLAICKSLVGNEHKILSQLMIEAYDNLQLPLNNPMSFKPPD